MAARLAAESRRAAARCAGAAAAGYVHKQCNAMPSSLPLLAILNHSTKLRHGLTTKKGAIFDQSLVKIAMVSTQLSGQSQVEALTKVMTVDSVIWAGFRTLIVCFGLVFVPDRVLVVFGHSSPW